MNILRKIYTALREQGIQKFLCRSYDYIRFKRAINFRRKQLAIQIAELHDWEVAYGPFKGMKISRSNWWGQTDLASKILGFYEYEVLETLTSIDKARYKNFIDLGAADGYYAVGMIHAKLFDKAICFEMSDQGRQVIQKNVMLNDLSEAICILGYADESFDSLIPDIQLSESVVLIDIEGAEFNLLTSNLIDKLKNSFLLIELHEFMVRDGESQLLWLIERLKKCFHINWLTTGSRNLSQFKDLEEFNDTDRWLLCSEGRTKLQKWLVCRPLDT